ncbi:cytochrome c oxidase assembly protein COX11, mitochondrial-like [Ornithodoros turicata]|uniref:cytochrome c oxidase assembly protein COX11, mitochondrial-like n=1 Tax=Ornithodoros turicata TaxID=34597 RepID=UPI00313A41E8
MLSVLLRCKTPLRVTKINYALVRYSGSYREQKNRSLLLYVSAFTIFVGGCSYAAVPLYRLFCQSTGRGGRAVAEDLGEKMVGLKKVSHRLIRVTFNADTASGLRWNFRPRQQDVTVYPGETVLAFYSAKNPSNEPVNGIATYNIIPFEAGKYFNKIQCFCFEEQRLNPHEEVDMPVFFYIDPEYAEDPRLEQVDDLTLSYTFFEAKEGLKLPVPTIR